jgi:beta-glucosidase
MKKTAFLLIVAFLFQTFCLQVQQSFGQTAAELAAADIPDSDAFLRKAMKLSKPRRDYSKQIEALLAKMTLEEKVGQMTQLTMGMIVSGTNQDVKPDPAKIEKAIVKYGVGSILNVSDQALSLDAWHEMIGEIQKASARTRLKIPNIYGIDSIHGANYIRGATLFPQQIGMAATWNPVLMHRAAEITAMETRAAAIPWSFSPVLDIGRQPLWPRFWETFGEDPYLAKVMGAAFVRGLEGDDLASEKFVASSLKHYIGYSYPLTGRDRTSAWIPENYLREYFLPTFEVAVKSGARTVMVNSAEINGVPGHVNKQLLTDVLKNELKFDGFIVSDWEDIKKLVTFWKVAADEKEATRMALMAGIDMSMVPLDYSFADLTIQLVKEKKVPMTRIDDAVRRILRVKFELGLFADPMLGQKARANFGRPEYAEVSLEAARESLVLLKNDNAVLPLTRGKKVLVTGPTADSHISLNNGWSWVWQGSEESLYPLEKPTIQKAIQQKISWGGFEFVQGTKITRPPNSPSNATPTDVDVEVDVDKAVEKAKSSDVVVLCLGEGSYTETPGNITDLTLPETQLRFAEKIIATGKPVVLVMVEGRPRVISRIADKVSGILLALNPSSEGGRAVADVLFGDYNPNGKLPFTYPRNPNNIVMYDHKLFETEATPFGNSPNEPQFRFGSGLSYTKFDYSNLKLSSASMPMTGSVEISVDVRNSGARAGKEAVIVFVRDEVATLSPGGKRVRRFAKVSLGAGQSKTLKFRLSKDDLSFVNANNKTIAEPGEFTVMIGGLSEKFTLK